MTDIDSVNTLSLPITLDTTRFFIMNSLALVHLYAKKTADILPAFELLKSFSADYDAYLATQMPARWHYDKKDDRYNRIGDIILVAHAPKVFNLNNRALPAATHGFDPAAESMHAVFYAWGPAFRENLRIREFGNIHIYPLIASLLKLKITDPIDGDIKVLRPILK